MKDWDKQELDHLPDQEAVSGSESELEGLDAW